MPYFLRIHLFFFGLIFIITGKNFCPLEGSPVSRSFDILILFKNIRKSHSLLIQSTVANHISEQKTLETTVAEMHAIEQCFVNRLW